MPRPSRLPLAPARHPWFARKLGAVVAQALGAAALLALLYSLVTTTEANLQREGITTGFAFLHQRAGFGIIQSLIPYSEEATYGRAFVVGLANTLLVAACGGLAATLLGFAVGLTVFAGGGLAARLGRLYIAAVRNMPLMLQLFFWYFAGLRSLPGPRQSYAWGEVVFLNSRGLSLPEPGPLLIGGAGGLALLVVVWRLWGRRRGGFLTFLAGALGLAGIISLYFFGQDGDRSWVASWPQLKGFNIVGGLTLIPEFMALLLALSLYTGAYIAEALAASLAAVAQRQADAAYSLGISPAASLRYILLPQALRLARPVLTNQYISLTKNSSLAAAIGYPDLVAVFAGTVLNQTGQAIEVMALTMAVYLSLSISLSFTARFWQGGQGPA